MIKLALRNITRQKIRTIMTLLAVVAGVAGLIVSGGFVQDIYVQLREFTIHSQTGHIQIYKKDYYELGTQAPLKYIIEDPEGVKKMLEAAGATLDDSMARLRFSGLISNGRADHAVIGEGIEPAKEERLGTYLNIIAGRQLKADDRFGVIIGEGVAQAQQISPGDRVTLVLNTSGGALNSLDFEVVGVFRTFSKEYDARAIRIDFASAQELLATRGATAIVLSLKDAKDVDPVLQILRPLLGDKGYELKAWYELSDFYEKTLNLYERQFGVLRLIILGMVLLGVANSVNISVMERVGEFGTMQAIGERSRTVIALVLTENAILGLAGSLIGVVVGLIAAMAVSVVGIPMPPPPNSDVGYIARIQLVPSIVLTGFVVGVIAACGAAIMPARRVARMPIVDALRYNI